MNTQTVLTIIEMINAKLISLKKAMLEEKLKKLEEQENAPVFISIDISAPAEYFHRRDELTELRDYLQEYIEAQVSAMENSTPE